MSSRRQFLRGLGAGLAMPWLPSVAGAASGEPPKRLVIFYSPNGMSPWLWRPEQTGIGWRPSPMLQALGGLRHRTAVISGLNNAPNLAPPLHNPAVRMCLTGGSAMSFDQAIADHLGGQTPLRSLQLGSEDAPCRLGDCRALRAISWLDQTLPAPRDTSVAAAFRGVFSVPPAPAGVGVSDAIGLRRSVLDAVRRDLTRFSSRAGTQDAQRLDAYAQALRDVEVRTERLGDSISCPAPASPPVVTETTYGGDDHIDAMLDLVSLTLQCDQARVVTYMMGDGTSDRPLHHLGIPLGHHELSHADFDDGAITMAHWVLSKFSGLAERLAGVQEADGSLLLDHTTLLFVSGMGNGAEHTRVDLPVLLAGRIGAYGGQHIAADDTPVSNLYTSIMRSFGMGVDSFGEEGTGSLLDL